MKHETMKSCDLYHGDCVEALKTIPDNFVDCCITSPPYYLMRDYGIEGQIGIEPTPEDYVKKLVAVFREVKRVLKDSGTLWVVIGDSYAGSRKGGHSGKHEYLDTEVSRGVYVNETMITKTLIGIPWRFALAMQADWLLRQDIIWAKSNPMPEPYKDRFCRSHEYIFLFSKQKNYYFNHKNSLEDSIIYNLQNQNLQRRGYAKKGDGHGLRQQHHGVSIKTGPYRTMRDVWFVATESSEVNHFAMFPQRLIMPCLLCGCPENGIVLDPFMGSGTTAVVAIKNFRRFIGCEINHKYIKIAKKRIKQTAGLFEAIRE
jgi:DNA modification methylase